MFNDIIENAQLFALGTWNTITEIVAPQPEKREAIRVGMHRLDQVRGKYRELDTILRNEEEQLNITHAAQRELLKERQTAETADMHQRHDVARSAANEAIRQVRAMVISDILNAGPAPVVS
jgi:hypothetical protein